MHVEIIACTAKARETLMKRCVEVILLISIVFSTCIVGGCVKKKRLVKAAVIAGVGTALAVLGNEVNATKRLGLNWKKKKKKIKDVAVKAEDVVETTAGDAATALDSATRDFLDSRKFLGELS